MKPMQILLLMCIWQLIDLHYLYESNCEDELINKGLEALKSNGYIDKDNNITHLGHKAISNLTEAL